MAERWRRQNWQSHLLQVKADQTEEWRWKPPSGVWGCGCQCHEVWGQDEHMCGIKWFQHPPLLRTPSINYSLRCTKPSMECKKENFIFLRGFVQMLAILSAEAMGQSQIEPLDTHSCTKWWWTSMCLVLLWIMGSLQVTAHHDCWWI